MNGPVSSSNRIDWIDCAKGYAILLVIIGHTVSGVLRGAIFSFHMPLFFILSSITFRCSSSREQFIQKAKKAFRHLILPAVAIYLLRTIVFVIQNITEFFSLQYVIQYAFHRVLTFVLASGVDITMNGVFIESLGIPWFLIALFLGRTLFDYLQFNLKRTALIISCAALSVAGVILGQLQWLPLSLDVVLAILPFFLIGNLLQGKPLNSYVLRNTLVYAVTWAGTLLLSFAFSRNYLELAARRYTLYPLCYVTAVSGTLALAGFSILSLKLGKIIQPLLILGKHSLVMLFIHCMDYLWEPFFTAGNPLLDACLITIADVIVFSVTMQLFRLFSAHRCIIEFCRKR